ncbi:hypothetical protein TEQG_01092 [Trichophyton equinum CBS 127.97]|uniref:Uncharacterized protein n=1 Tax=Trichophyton equinum (strain ATCC MYA-4606 / CBS 127.97) TaxID=559882 RepID=F2PJI5_TRIEC|nr:hypothetical protein TEQG_01092 [Trichophyton equinum CBS 127.97]
MAVDSSIAGLCDELSPDDGCPALNCPFASPSTCCSRSQVGLTRALSSSLIEILVALASLQATTLFDHFSSFSSHTQMLSGLKTGVQTKTQLETLLCRKQDPELALVRLPQPSIRNVQQPETTAHLPTRLAFYHYSQLPQGH